MLTLRIALVALFAFAAGICAANPNAVGYLNKDLPPGFSLISTPLRGETAFPLSSLPNGFAIYFIRSNRFEVATFDAAENRFLGAELPPELFKPGAGFFVHNPLNRSITITMAGEVAQGKLTNEIPAGLSILSSIVPQRGTLEELGLPLDPSDAVYIFNSRLQRYSVHIFDDLGVRWTPNPRPVLETGDAFFLRTLRARQWVRDFSVNQ